MSAYTDRLAQATPSWADRRALYYIYNQAADLREQGLNVVVDHIIPLAGRDVCGLNVIANLQIVESKANSKKSNFCMTIPAIPHKQHPQLSLF